MIDKQEFLSYTEDKLQEILGDFKFVNYKRQVIAWSISPNFKRTYDETYLWNRALFLSTNGSYLYLDKYNKHLGIRCLKESAELYEFLSIISEKYDREYCLILSSICYDLAGYQANAVCLIKKVIDYNFETNNDDLFINADNYILGHIKLILGKQIVKGYNNISNQVSFDIGLNIFNRAIKSWYENILNGKESMYIEEVTSAYKYYLNSSNSQISHLLFLLKVRFSLYFERSIWETIGKELVLKNSNWRKYIKLLTNDLYDNNGIKDVEKRISKFEFWTSQLRAIEKGLLSTDSNFVIQMPTSAGKTFIAEISILDSLLKNAGKKCIYISPFRALSNEKESELSLNLSKLGFTVSALSGSYEIDEFQDLILNETDVLIATPEKVDLLFRTKNDYFNDVSLIVVDEGHIVGEITSRSSLVEFLIIRIRLKVPNVRILFISAVMPAINADEYSIWLNGFSNYVIRSLLSSNSTNEDQWEPTRKLIGEFTWEGINGKITYKDISVEDEETLVSSGTFIPAFIKKKQFANKYPNGINKAQTSASLAYEFSKFGNCLIFCAQVRNAESVGKALLELIDELEKKGEAIPSNFIKDQNRESYFFSSKWYGSNSIISKCLERGIGLHFGDLPESIRRSVESDYNLGKLKILLATNTIGQGLNFPIKYLIIHSTLISHEKFVSVRDFWNIIGRAGRAGKETEGQVIFVNHTYTDSQSFRRYTNKQNIEEALSMFFNVLDLLNKNRITIDDFDKFIGILSEPYILNLLVEESLESQDEELVNKLIDNSLFKVQSLSRNLNIDPLKKSFRSIISQIREDNSPESIRVYSLTGFTLASNKQIENYINSNLIAIQIFIEEDDYISLLKFIFEMFDSQTIIEINSEKLSRITNKPSDFFEFCVKWIEGLDIELIQVEWLKKFSEVNSLNILIADGFYYRYAWCVTAFITILAYKFNLEIDELPTNIRSLSSYIKYGLNNRIACLARSIGIKNRDIALYLATFSKIKSEYEFIKWVANLNNEEIDNLDINQYDKNNIITTSLKLTPNRYHTIPTEFNFFIKGIPFIEERKTNSLIVNSLDKLKYVRDTGNNFDPFAIRIYLNELELGFVPREYSRLIAIEIDINSTNYKVEVINTFNRGSYNDIYIKMSLN